MKKTIQSPIADGVAKIVRYPNTIVYKGCKVDYLHTSYRCLETGQEFTMAEIDDINIKNIKNAYNKKH